MPKALDAIYAVVAAATAPWWMRKARGGWSERFGKIQDVPKAPGDSRKRLLIHAVSVGEVNLTRPLVERLCGTLEIVVASTTDTGIKRAHELYDAKCHVVRYPLDASWSVRRFMDAVRPDGVALVELELWPHFMDECRRRGIPVGVVNGRLSDKSFPRYRFARPLVGKYFAQLAFAGVQDETYARRFREVGVEPQRCHVAGSMKWDSADVVASVPGSQELAREMGIDPTRPLVVAGSTAPGEDALLHASVPSGVQLLCAPRRPEHCDDAARALPGCIRRSAKTPAPPGTTRYLLDTLGELRKAYSLADVIVIGRSFGRLYGSDPMEAAALGKPVVIGPAVANFRSMVEALREDQAIIQTDAQGLPSALAGLLGNANERTAMGQRATKCVLRHKGATERHARLLLEMLHVREATPSIAEPKGEVFA